MYLEEKMNNATYESDNIVIGNRIPKDFFVTCGRGESDITVHAGSYHLALRNANIEMCNIITYSSILPGIANRIERPNVLVHGSVLESIMAVHNCQRGEMGTVGIIYGWLHDKKTSDRYGGLVCEYNGTIPEEAARKQLSDSLFELYENGYSDDFVLRGISLMSDSFVPRKKYGTVLNALCFVSYEIPIISGQKR